MTSLLEILRTCAWIVLAAALAVLCRLLLKDVDVRRMKSLALLRLPASVRWALAVLALAGFFVAGGKPGGTNGTNRAGVPTRIVRSGMMDTPEEGLRFTDIRVTPTQVELGFAWNEALVQGLGPLEVFARPALTTGPWSSVYTLPAMPWNGRHVVQLPRASLPGGGGASTFFTVAAGADPDMGREANLREVRWHQDNGFRISREGVWDGPRKTQKAYRFDY